MHKYRSNYTTSRNKGIQDLLTTADQKTKFDMAKPKCDTQLPYSGKLDPLLMILHWPGTIMCMQAADKLHLHRISKLGSGRDRLTELRIYKGLGGGEQGKIILIIAHTS